MERDPLCNMMFDEKKTKYISELKNKKIYLCSASCKNQFDQNPQKYGKWKIQKSIIITIITPGRLVVVNRGD